MKFIHFEKLPYFSFNFIISLLKRQQKLSPRPEITKRPGARYKAQDTRCRRQDTRNKNQKNSNIQYPIIKKFGHCAFENWLYCLCLVFCILIILSILLRVFFKTTNANTNSLSALQKKGQWMFPLSKKGQKEPVISTSCGRRKSAPTQPKPQRKTPKIKQLKYSASQGINPLGKRILRRLSPWRGRGKSKLITEKTLMRQSHFQHIIKYYV